MVDRSQQGALIVKAVFPFSFLIVLGTAVLLDPTTASAQTRPAAQPQTRPATPQTRPAAPRVSRTATPAPARRRSPIAVVDISYIFKNHHGFKAAMDRMKKEVEAYEEHLRTQQNALMKEKERLSDYRPGSENYDALERSLADKGAKLQVDMQMKRKEFLEREARVYYDVYRLVAAAIQGFAEQNGIELVLRYSGEPMDPANRQSVLQGVNRPIVYHRQLDITREVLDRLNRTQVSDQTGRTPTPGGRR
jgi:Skp family chaperone for outer membrane proteins